MPLKILLLYYALINFWLFVLFAADKRRAAKNGRRVAEKTLLLLGLAGGAPGGFFAMKLFRHKSRKIFFHLIYILSVLLHVYVLYLLFRAGWH